jgi:hypothetical protein
VYDAFWRGCVGLLKSNKITVIDDDDIGAINSMERLLTPSIWRKEEERGVSRSSMAKWRDCRNHV